MKSRLVTQMAQVESIGAKCQHFLFVHQHIGAKFQQFFCRPKQILSGRRRLKYGDYSSPAGAQDKN